MSVFHCNACRTEIPCKFEIPIDWPQKILFRLECPLSIGLVNWVRQEAPR